MTDLNGNECDINTSIEIDFDNPKDDHMFFCAKLEHVAQSTKYRKHYTFHYWTLYKDGTEGVEYASRSLIKVVFRLGGHKIFYKVNLHRWSQTEGWARSDGPNESEMNAAVMSYITTMELESTVFDTETNLKLDKQ